MESYNWKTHELKEVSQEPFLLEIDKSLKEIEFKKVKFPYTVKGNSILWEVLYPSQDRGAKLFVGDEIEFDMQLGSFKRHFKFLELEKSFEEMNGAEIFIAIEATASVQDASVGVCAQVKSVHCSYGPPKYSTKGKFRSQLHFFFVRTSLVRQ